MHFIDLLNSKKIKFKIIILFVLILILPLTILTIISLNRTYTVAENNINKDLNNALSLFRENLEDNLDTLKLRAKTLVDFEIDKLVLSGFPEKETLQKFESELIKSDLDYLALVENRSFPKYQVGKFSSDTLNHVILPAVCQSSLGVNMFVINDTPWIFTSAMITKIKGGKILHVVFAQKLKHDFADKLKALNDAEYTIYYKNKKMVTTKMDPYGRRQNDSIIEKPELEAGKMTINGVSYSFIHNTALPNRISRDIKVEIAIPDSVYTDLGNKIQNDFLVFGFFGLLLAIITGTILAMNIAEPINELAVSTSKVANGDLNIENKIIRDDEIGILSNNFSEMVNNLKQEKEQKELRMKELNTLFEISNAVNIFTNSEELLKYVLSHAIDVLQAQRGSIMLLDDQTDELVIKVATGGRYRAISSNPIKLGAGVCGKVALEGQGIISNEGFKDSRFENFGSIIPIEDINSLICAPLKFKEGTIGVINIVNKKDNQLFNENDLRLLSLIGNQAAITIENNKLYELSITDGMTHLYVHRYFQARLSEEILRARRYGINVSLIMIDIDNFKKFNDTYGHQVGDTVIQTVAATIKETIRTGIDIPCRYGGEELCIILPETKSEDAYLSAERIRKNIAAIGLPHSSGELHITVSVGVAAYPIHGKDKDSLIKASDNAMYTSKKLGKNRTTIAEELKA